MMDSLAKFWDLYRDGLINFALALLLLLAFYVAGRLLGRLTRKALAKLNTDERAARWLNRKDVEGPETVSLEEPLSSLVYYVIMAFGLVAFLGQLGLQALLAPVQGLLDSFAVFLPNLLSAAVILLLGLFIARIVRQVIKGLLGAVGLDKLGERAGVKQSLSGLVSTVAYVAIMLPVIVQALESLNLPAIAEPATRMIGIIFAALPGIIGAAFVLGVSFVIGRLIATLVTELAASVGLNELPAKLGLDFGGKRKPAEFVGHIVLVGIMLFAALGAADLLAFDALTTILVAVLGFAGQALLAVAILTVGLYLANLVRGMVLDAGGAKLTAMVARVAILTLSSAMALRQLGVAQDIVNLTFGILLAGAAVSLALAFGIGGRDIAGRELERFIDKARQSEQEAQG
ncbi:MAG: mechanosensitive ion channel [Actinomycetota bacterium]|nr:mechanosensitive ion channel [Actinomycetota bacterium]